ncbi:MAG: WG repeat-containing protein [Mucilaginibacter sp.]
MKPILITILFITLIACNKSKNYLIRVNDKNDNCGYINLKGDTIIPFGKYLQCFTDTFRNYAIVSKRKTGVVAIDRNENVLFNIFLFDNGPDYPSEGLFRIVKDGKIGYADSNFTIKIQAQYGCALPFANGVAKVSIECKTVHVEPNGEHSAWVSNNWFYINKSGVRVKNQHE